uniref:Secreted protein n=1 Tax=Anser brachyrhynchus TaxID=132585 RepID=A0A8B9C2H2_9AVES
MCVGLPLSFLFPLFSSSQLPEGKEGHRLITATEDFFHGNRCLLRSTGCLCVELSPLSRDCHCRYYLHDRFSSRLPARSCSRNSVLQPSHSGIFHTAAVEWDCWQAFLSLMASRLSRAAF